MRLRNAFYMAAFVGLTAGAASAQDRAARFDQRDADGDGRLSSHEYQSTGGHPGNFRALDANGDGLLTRGEFVGREGVQEQAENRVYREDDRVYKDTARRRSGESVKVNRAGNPDVLTKSGSAKGGYLTEGFRNKDRNRDRVLSRREYGQASTFDRVDRNDDGVINEWEFLNPPPASASRAVRRDRD